MLTPMVLRAHMILQLSTWVLQQRSHLLLLVNPKLLCTKSGKKHFEILISSFLNNSLNISGLTLSSNQSSCWHWMPARWVQWIWSNSTLIFESSVGPWQVTWVCFAPTYTGYACAQVQCYSTVGLRDVWGDVSEMSSLFLAVWIIWDQSSSSTTISKTAQACWCVSTVLGLFLLIHDQIYAR